MSQTAVMNKMIDFCYEANGDVRCQNPRGLVFFLRAEPPVSQPAKPAWQPVPATKEVAVRREAEAKPIAEKTQAIPQPAQFQVVETTREVEARRVVEAAPAPAPQAAPAEPGDDKGWFNKLFKR